MNAPFLWDSGETGCQKRCRQEECVQEVLEGNKDILGHWLQHTHAMFWHRVCLHSARVWRNSLKLKSKPVNQVTCTGNIKKVSIRAVTGLVLIALVQVCSGKAAKWSRRDEVSKGP